VTTRDSFESGGFNPQPALHRIVTYDAFESPKDIPTLLGNMEGSGCSKAFVQDSAPPAVFGLTDVAWPTPALLEPHFVQTSQVVPATIAQQPIAARPAHLATPLQPGQLAQPAHPAQATPALQAAPVAQAPSAKSMPKAKKGACQTLEQSRTTIMLRNLPNNYTREGLLELLDSQGFAGKYDFLYFPIDFRTHAALGYAFVNCLNAADAEALRQTMEGYTGWTLPSSKVCHTSWSHPHQGLVAHIERYRNSPLMHESVPDTYRPMLFENGVRVKFPLPTKRIKPPRQGTQRMLV